MRATISMVLEYVAAALPKEYRVRAEGDGGPYVVVVNDSAGKLHREFPVRRDELATEARAEWVAISIARKIREARAP